MIFAVKSVRKPLSWQRFPHTVMSGRPGAAEPDRPGPAACGVRPAGRPLSPSRNGWGPAGYRLAAARAARIWSALAGVPVSSSNVPYGAP